MREKILYKELTYYLVLFVVTIGIVSMVHSSTPAVEAFDVNVEPSEAVISIDSEVILYRAQMGDTIETIAQGHGVDPELVAAINGLTLDEPIDFEETIVIPNEQLMVHTVALGESLWRIANHYGVDINVIAEENKITDVTNIKAGQSLVITKPVFMAGKRVGNMQQAKPVVSRGGFNLGFIWPTAGFISSPFGMRNGVPHRGLDIANMQGEPIYAAARGEVIFAGPRGNYGNAVIIDHGNGYSTLYAHASKTLVTAGDVVIQGQEIAKIGSTGRSTGPHLHFEVIIDNERKNPINYLPKKR